MLHEWGHNLGLLHSSGMVSTHYLAPADFAGVFSERGDPTNVLGRGGSELSVVGLWRFGVLKEVEGEIISLNTDYSVPLKLQLLSSPFGYRSGAYIGAKFDFTGEGHIDFPTLEVWTHCGFHPILMTMFLCILPSACP